MGGGGGYVDVNMEEELIDKKHAISIISYGFVNVNG